MVEIKALPRGGRRRSFQRPKSILRYLQIGLGFYFSYLFLATFFLSGESPPEEPVISKNTPDLNINYQRNLSKNKPMGVQQVLESSKKSVAKEFKAREYPQKKTVPFHVAEVAPQLMESQTYLTPEDVKDQKLVHVIHTRFMQYQPDLAMLGKARLKLFQTFCLPTLINQRSQEFLWIIRTDPELHTEVKEGLITLVTGIKNVVVVGSNEIRKGSMEMGFRSVDAISDITEESLFYGNLDLVKAYYEAAKTKTLLETNLDADDGLASMFVKRSQEVVMELFKANDEKQRRKQRRQQSSFMTLCAGRHAEWQFYVPWDIRDQSGSLKLGSTHVCITAGLTWASQYKAAPRFTESHHLIKKETPACKDEFEHGNDYTSPTFLAHGLHEDMGCWLQIPTDEYTDLTAIRARTPTSTGMSRVTTAASKWTADDKTQNDNLWAKVAVGGTFRIRRKQVIETHTYLDENLPAIVEENLKGQCQKDHSCSEGIKKKLKSILYKEDAWRGEHGMVHVVQTAIEDPISVDVWRHFCLESLEVQSSYDFLWIIRIKGFDSNPQMAEAVNKVQMLKILEKSALNIIVVKSDGTPSMNFREKVAIADITADAILFGNLFTVENFHKAAQNSTLLETTLDPTEALSKTFIEDMQKSAAVQQEHGQEKAAFAWYYRCQSTFVEWNYFHPNQNDEQHLGYSRLNNANAEACGTNPGTTRISQPGAAIPFFADVSQAEKCQKMVVLRAENGCFVSMESEEPIVARAVIPDSIDKPEPAQLTDSELEEIQEADGHMGTVLRYAFNILPYSIGIIHAHIQESQCGDGNVCNSKLDSDYGVVQVVQTWIPGPDYFDIWRQFCFSIEAQTSKKFLWIIRIPNEADKNFIHQVAKPLHKTPLNVIIAKSSRSSDANFRQAESIADITSKNLILGDLETLKYFHEKAQEKPLLETKLDATDSLIKTFVDDVQKIVAHQVQTKQLVDQENAYYYQCASQYVEWNYHNPRGEEASTGFLKNIDVDINSCLEHPGRTRVSMPQAKTGRGSSGQGCSDKRKGLVDGCFDVVLKRKQGEYPQWAARVLVPNVLHGALRKSVDDETMKELRNTNDLLKGHMKHEFGVYPVNMKNMRKKLEEFGIKHQGLRGAGQEEASTTDSWSNSRGIVHVVHTRLLQRQPTLLTLGKVRLDIFKTLCLTTMSQQTNKQFLWIIRTDPDLDQKLKENLLIGLEGITNVVVIASREGSDGIYNGQFREHHAMREFHADSIVHGNLTLVQSYHEAAKSHILLETNIDSDDGVALTFVENLQAMTLEAFERDSFQVGWINLCLGRHLEWHFYAPWQKKSEKGCLLLGSTRNCVKSGLSWAVNVKAKPKFMTSTHLIKENKEQCSMNRTAAERLIQECWDEVPLGDPDNDVTAIRSMTPASNGIARGEVSKFDWNIDALKYDGEAWDLLEAYFGVNSQDIIESRRLLVDNMHDVVVENDRSACTHEKTCIGHWKNKYRLVHVVYVSIFDPNLADVFRRVSLSSLVGQTSSEFLMIARAEDFTDQRLTDTLLKGIRDSAIADNILLVKSNRTHQLDFRSEAAISDINEETLLHGNLDVLKDYHDAAQNRTVLETFLHSYEGFKRDYVEELQNATVTNIIHDRVQKGSSGWYYQCVPAFVERTYFSPNGQEQKNGFYVVVSDADSKCMKRPGLTRISNPGSEIPDDTKFAYAEECSLERDLGDGCFIASVSDIVPALRVFTDLVAKPTELDEEKIQALNKMQFSILRELRAEFSVFPPTLKNMRKEVEENQRQIVHIIHSSLHDPAEINPWRHFLVDSLQLQTSKNFFYILRTTNFTNEKDMYNLMYPLSTNHEKGHIETIVVDSEYVPLHDFRTSEAIEDIMNSTILRGEMSQLIDIHKAAGARTVIETFLEPNEAVSASFVADLQESVLSQMKQNQMQGVQLIRDYEFGMRRNWYYDCNSEYVEWQYHTPSGEDNKIGFLKLITADHDSNCVSKPGTTRVVLPGSIAGSSSFKVSSGKLCQSGKFVDGCFVPSKMHDETKVAKAIIPASTENAVPLQASQAAIKKLETQDKMLSKMLGDSFNISPYSIEIMRATMHERECSTEGKFCTGHLDSQYGVVHVVQTLLKDPEMFDAWRKWSFALEAQTSHKFLYILRVAPGDEKLMKSVLKPVNKTPLNIIVVESGQLPSVEFRHPDGISDITEETMRKGKLDMLQHYHKTAQEKPLLETFLDVTDVLSLTFANDIQKATPEIIQENKLDDGPSAWYYQCVPKYMAWEYFTPRGDEVKGGFLRMKAKEAGECVDLPGSTRISLPKAKIPTASGATTECASGKLGDGCSLPIVSKKVLAARLFLPKEASPPAEAGLTEDDFERLEKENSNLAKILKEDFNIPAMNRNQLQAKFKETLVKNVAMQK